MSIDTPAVTSPLTGLPTNADERAALERRKVPELAREFEAMLMLQMVRQMRQSFLSADDEEEGKGFGKEVLTDTMDVELSRQLAASGGIGLAKSIEAAMNRMIADPAGAATGIETGSPAVLAPSGATTPLSLTPAAATPRTLVPAAAAAPRSLTPRAAGSSVELPHAPDGGPTHSGGINAVDGAEASLVASTTGSLASDDPLFRANLTMPLDTALSSSYGWRADPFHGQARFHAGVDFRAAYGTNIPVAAPGTVTFAGEQKGYGLIVVVQHAGNVQTRYAHLSSLEVTSGEELASGQTVGRVGQTGRATGPHLHFEVLLDGARVDPALVAQRVPAGFKWQGMRADSSGDHVSVEAPSNGVDNED